MSLQQVNYTQIRGGVPNILDFGADNTGSADSTSAIQTAINTLSTGGVLYIPPGTYKTTTITLKSNITLLIEGTLVNTTSITLQPPTTQGPGQVSDHPTLLIPNGSSYININGGVFNTPMYEAIKSISSSNINISNCVIYGDRSNNFAYDGIHDNGSSFVEITNCEIYNRGGILQSITPTGWGDAITLFSSSNSKVINCNLHDCYASGVYVYDCTEITIINNTINNVGINGVFFNYPNLISTAMRAIASQNIIKNTGHNGIDCSCFSTAPQLVEGIFTDNLFENIGFLPTNTGNFDGLCVGLNLVSNIVVDGNIARNTNRGFSVADQVLNVSYTNNNHYTTVTSSYFVSITAGSPLTCSNIVIDSNTANVNNHFVQIGSGATANEIIVSNNNATMGGYPFFNVSTTAAVDVIIDGNTFNSSVTGGRGFGALLNGKITNNTFGVNLAYELAGTSIVVGNKFYESVTGTNISNMVITDNNFQKGLTLSGAVSSTIGNNIINAGVGAYEFIINTINGPSTYLSVLGNICYPNSGTNESISSNATYSVFANITNGGTKTITGTGTIVLY